MTPRAASRLLPWLVLVAAAATIAVAWMVREPAPRADSEFRITPEQGARLGAMMKVPEHLRAEYRLESGRIGESSGVFRYARAAGGAIAFEVHHADAVAHPVGRTERFALRQVEGAPSMGLVANLVGQLRAGERDFTWIEAADHPTGGWLRQLPQLQWPIAWALLATTPFGLVLALHRAARILRRLDRRERLLLVAAVACAALARLVAPLRLVMLYIGYQLTQQAIDLESIPRYGAGVPVLHHVLLNLLPPVDHRAILIADSVMGVALVPLASALLLAITSRPRAAIASAFLLAVIPALVAHDNSESYGVPLLLLLVAGLVLLAHALTGRSTLSLVGAAALLTYAAIGRPELPIVTVAAALAVLIATEGADRRFVLARAIPLVIAFALLVAPHVVHVVESAAMMAHAGSLPLVPRIRGYIGFIPVAVIDPRLYPIALAPLPLVALAARPTRRAAVALLALSTVATALTFLDVDPSNILRVQAPAMLWDPLESTCRHASLSIL